MLLKKMRRKAPAGCYWRGRILWGRARVQGRTHAWSLHTDDPALAAERYDAHRRRLLADAYHGNAKRGVAEVMQEWKVWIKTQVGTRTAQRYATSLEQLGAFLEGRSLSDIDGRLIAQIIRDRSKTGVTNATIRRDLVAVSSVLNFAIDQGWREENAVLPRMRRIRERRDPIVMPKLADIELVIHRCPGMIADLVRVAIATGARQGELVSARRDQIDHARRQMTIIGKGNKLRVIDLDPFDGYRFVSALRAHSDSPLLFWHSNGKPYRQLHSRFPVIVQRTRAWAAKRKVEFRPFRFHDLRHWHAVQWLKDGRSIYDLQQRLGHSSLKTTEAYCAFLTAEEARVVKGLAQFPAQTVPSTDQLPIKVQ